MRMHSDKLGTCLCNKGKREEADYPTVKDPSRCKLYYVPWCCGAADDLPEHCDACAAKARAA